MLGQSAAARPLAIRININNAMVIRRRRPAGNADLYLAIMVGIADRVAITNPLDDGYIDQLREWVRARRNRGDAEHE